MNGLKTQRFKKCHGLFLEFDPGHEIDVLGGADVPLRVQRECADDGIVRLLALEHSGYGLKDIPYCHKERRISLFMENTTSTS
jgi:hypothetical protein